MENSKSKSIKNAQRVQKLARETARKTYQGVKVAVKATISAVKAIIAGTKAWISAIIAGGCLVLTLANWIISIKVLKFNFEKFTGIVNIYSFICYWIYVLLF